MLCAVVVVVVIGVVVVAVVVFVVVVAVVVVSRHLLSMYIRKPSSCLLCSGVFNNFSMCFNSHCGVVLVLCTNDCG